MNHSAMPIPGAVPASPRTAHPLIWAALGALGATTLALGAALVQVQHRTADEVAPAIPLTPASTVEAVLPDPAPQALPAPVVAPVPEKVKKVALTPAKSAQAAPKTVAKTVPANPPKVVDAQPARDAAWEPVAAAPQPVARVVCTSCGTVESVTPIQREAKPSGAGAVAGAVLGGLVGNQFGGGDGKALATIAGVLGGGWAGNTVEKNMKKDIVYEVSVRMEDGSLRRFEQGSPPAVGAKVTVDGNSIGPAHAAPAPSYPTEAHTAT